MRNSVSVFQACAQAGYSLLMQRGRGLDESQQLQNDVTDRTNSSHIHTHFSRTLPTTTQPFSTRNFVSKTGVNFDISPQSTQLTTITTNYI